MNRRWLSARGRPWERRKQYATDDSDCRRYSGSRSKRMAPLLVEAGAVGLDHAAIPVSRPLQETPLGGVIDVHQPEAHFVPLLPLEVVEQGPVEVADSRHPLIDGPLKGEQIA